MLLADEEITKLYLEQMVIPKLKEILKNASPQKWEQWQHNCCKQCAITAAYYLEKFLPDYNWTVWDGLFDDTLYGKPVHYNHAWTFGKNSKGKRLFVDMGRIHTETLFLEVSANRYPLLKGYEDLKEKHREQLDWHKMLETEVEYFTAKSPMEIISKIDKELNRRQSLIDPFINAVYCGIKNKNK